MSTELKPGLAFRPRMNVPSTQLFSSEESNQALGPLSSLVGSWKGGGFNGIWVPHSVKTDRFLALSMTNDSFTFDQRIPGVIPNRGLKEDVMMVGLTYFQQVSDASDPSNVLHIEPGILAIVPATSTPSVPQSIVRMASIPHGTALLAQGIAEAPIASHPDIPACNLLPFPMKKAAEVFTELNLSIPGRKPNFPGRYAGGGQ